MNPNTMKKVAVIAIILYALLAVCLTAGAAKVRIKVIILPWLGFPVPVILPLPG